MKINIGFVGLDPLVSTIEIVQLAESYNIDGVVSSEHLGFHDGIVPSALYLQNTSKLEVSMVGLNDVSRHPGLLAMEIASLAEIGAGRLRVQVGTGNAGLVAKIGGSKERPIPRVKALVGALRSLLNGEQLSYESAAGNFSDFGLQASGSEGIVPYSGESVPIDIMAVQPAMLRLSAQIADGVALSGGCSQVYIAETVALLEAELKKRGRDRSEFRITAYTYCVVDPNVEKLVSNIRLVLGSYAPQAAANLMKGVFDGQAYVEAAEKDKQKAVDEFLTMDVLSQVGIVAKDVDGVKPALQRYINTGVDALCIHLVGPMETRPYAIRCISEARESLKSSCEFKLRLQG